jgi:hypothetical protein
LAANYSDLLVSENNWFDSIVNPVTPLVSELNDWLVEDDTNNYENEDEFSQLYLAMVLRIKARAKNWELGIISLKGNFTLASEYTINTASTNEGTTYIDPSNDETWSYNGLEMEVNQTWMFGGNRILITEINHII